MKDNKQKYINDELLELEAESLLKIKQSKSEIPENYFENLNASVLKKIELKESPKKSTSKRYLIALSIAASFLLFISINLIKSQKSENSWSEISSIELKNYIAENIEDFSEDEIASLASVDYSVFDFSEETSNEELINYIIDSEISDDELF